jgi:holo-[acyl-carrier protein] synthase
MILGIGVDSIEIDRFVSWYSYLRKKLLRIFSPQEIDYCLEKPDKSAERFATRFAAREALYKALSYAYPQKKIPFLTLCSHVSIITIDSRPYFIIRDSLGINLNNVVVHLSLSHSSIVATAFVVIEQR